MIRQAVSALALTLLAVPAWADNTPAPSPANTMEAPSWQPKNGDRIAFDVLRKGKPFGTHTVSFAVDPDGTLTATTDVRLKAGLGPITVFRYELDATETWKDGTLVALKGAVDDDGKDGTVTAAREGDVLEVKGTEYTGEAPLGILPSSHWNFAQTTAKQLLSTEDGELLKVKVIDKGMDTVSVAGKSVEARHYLMDSAIDVDLWYDDQGRWVKLSFVARDQQIDYVLTQPY
ncbi:MAG: DUF6134 family protein [Hyphomonas sp.]|uniref:DUF6134 family protein n=1 Tax=Hyphomonas sp. TaxID=87 RepID=UPI0030034042